MMISLSNPLMAGDSVQGPYATAAEAERETRKTMADVDQIIRTLERAGLVRRATGTDGVVRSQAVKLPPEEAERAWRRLASEYSEEELARMAGALRRLRGDQVH
jgi:hypothetical protein